ncbi:MAG TPA: TonB-dependent receptor [Fontimonas sp.]
MRPLFLRGASAAVLGLMVQPLQAQTSVAATIQATALPPIQVTASRNEQPLAQVPQAVSVIDAQAIARETPGVVTDLLRGQAGVFVQSSGPGQGIPIVRGLKGSEVLHLVDGMRLNMAFFRNSPSQYVALVDPYNLTRIELLRGSGSTLYGSDAMGGVLQMFTPERRFDGEAMQFSAGARASYASADLAKIGRADFAVGKSGISFAGGYTTMDFGSYDTSRDGRQPFTSYRSNGGDAKLLWSPAAGHELMLSAQWMKSPKLPRYFEIVGGPGGTPDEILPVFFKPSERQFLHARYRITAPLGFIDQLDVHLAQQIIDDERERLVDPQTRENEQNRSTLNGLTIQALSRRGALSWTYGVDVYDDSVDSAKQRSDLESGELSVRAPTFPDGAGTLDIGAYLDTEWQAGRRWLLQGGVRYNRIETDLTATALSPAARVDNDDVSVRIGSAFALNDALRWTSNLARGFRAPNIFDLGTLGRRPNSDPQVINVPNPALGKETIVSVDTGLKWFRDGLQAELAVFHAWHDDRIEPREPTGNTVPNGQFGCSADNCIEVRSENLAQARIWGLESMLRLPLAKSLDGYMTLNYTRGEERKQGQSRPANRIPPINGQIGLAWQAAPSLRAESYVRFAGRQDRLDDDDQGDTRIDPNGTPGWATVNLRLGWTPVEALSLQLDGINLLDQAYREHGSGIDGEAVGVIVGATYRY